MARTRNTGRKAVTKPIFNAYAVEVENARPKPQKKRKTSPKPKKKVEGGDKTGRNKTVVQLKKEAKDKGIKNFSRMRRQELCNALGYTDCGGRANKKSPAKKSPAKKSPAKKSPAKKSPAKKSPAKKFPKEHLLGRSPSPLNSPKSPAKKSPAKRRKRKQK